jgi:non-ribosomal peptide synthase protein (TIGR01720 family)
VLVAHHLAVDGVSWRILLADMSTAWANVREGRTPTLALPPTSLRQWADGLVAEAQQLERIAEVSYWRAVLDPPAPLVRGTLDRTRDTIATAGRVSRALSVTATDAVLTGVPAAFHAGVQDVLLAALAIAAGVWRRRQGGAGSAVLLNLERHGRDEGLAGVDLSRTVGWFTTLYPVRLDLAGVDLDEAIAGGAALGQALKRIKETLRQVPDRGLGFGLLRHLNPDTASVLAPLAPPQLGFNYFGRFSAATGGGDWAFVDGTTLGGDADADQPLAYAIEVNAVTRETPDGPQLHAHWTWAPSLIDATSAHALADAWFDVLERLVAHADSPRAGGFTPSDVALAGLSQSDIEQLELTYRQRLHATSAR